MHQCTWFSRQVRTVAASNEISGSPPGAVAVALSHP